MELANLDSQQCRQTDPAGVLVSQVCSLLLCSSENLALNGYARLEFIHRFSEILNMTDVMEITSVALQAHIRMTNSNSNRSENIKLLHEALELLLVSLQNAYYKTTADSNAGHKMDRLNDFFSDPEPANQFVPSDDLFVQG